MFNEWWYSTILSKNMEDSLAWHYLEALEIDKQLRKVLKTYKHLYPYQYDWDPQKSFVFGDDAFVSYLNIIKFLNNVIKIDSKGYWAAAFTCGVSYDEVCNFYGKGETVRDTESDYTVLFNNMFKTFGEGPEVKYIFKG